MAVEYTHTNESLPSIVAGLKITPVDRVLAICGSGDQALAIVETAAEVVAIDNSSEQLEYAMEQADNIRSGRYERFLNPRRATRDYTERARRRRNSYFGKPGRLERITQRLNALYFVQADLLDLPYEINKLPFDKIYLSSVFCMTESRPEEGFRAVQHLTRDQPRGGKVYSVARKNRYTHGFSWAPFEWDERLEVDKLRTAIARWRELRIWSPKVYRRV